MSILSKSIKDRLLVDTMYKIFQSPVKDLNKGIGVSQDNPISPILANIYLNELDYFIESLKKKLNKSNASPKFKLEFTKAVGGPVPEFSVAKVKSKRHLYREKVKLALKSGIKKNVKIDGSRSKYAYYKIFYVRYADDYLIGIKGPKFLAVEITKRVSYFLKSVLHFSLKESGIVHALHDKVDFLGFRIKVTKNPSQAAVETRKMLSFKKIRHRLIQRKKTIEDRYNKSLLETYNSIIKSELKRLCSGEKLDKDMKMKQLVTYDAIILHEIASSNNKT